MLPWSPAPGRHSCHQRAWLGSIYKQMASLAASGPETHANTLLGTLATEGTHHTYMHTDSDIHHTNTHIHTQGTPHIHTCRHTHIHTHQGTYTPGECTLVAEHITHVHRFRYTPYKYIHTTGKHLPHKYTCRPTNTHIGAHSMHTYTHRHTQMHSGNNSPTTHIHRVRHRHTHTPGQLHTNTPHSPGNTHTR